MTRKQGETKGKNGAERGLWCAVILTALDDARGAYMGSYTADTAATMRRQARNWLTVPNADFNTVCHLAGLDPEAVREGARRALKGRGVGSDFPDVLGTGAGSVAQHFPQLEFSE